MCLANKIDSDRSCYHQVTFWGYIPWFWNGNQLCGQKVYFYEKKQLELISSEIQEIKTTIPNLITTLNKEISKKLKMVMKRKLLSILVKAKEKEKDDLIELRKKWFSDNIKITNLTTSSDIDSVVSSPTVKTDLKKPAFPEIESKLPYPTEEVLKEASEILTESQHYIDYEKELDERIQLQIFINLAEKTAGLAKRDLQVANREFIKTTTLYEKLKNKQREVAKKVETQIIGLQENRYRLQNEKRHLIEINQKLGDYKLRGEMTRSLFETKCESNGKGDAVKFISGSQELNDLQDLLNDIASFKEELE